MMNAVGLPVAASSIAPEVDHLLYAVAGVTITVTVALFVLLVVFGIRYREGSAAPRDPAPPPAEARNRRRIEIAWTLTPLLLFIGAFAWGAHLYVERATPPRDAMEVFVVAKQWMWKLQHPGGQREIDELHVPRGRAVKLVMTSQDVIHSFFVPAFRLKQDVLPGAYTVMWFTATEAGRFHLFCAEYCGTSHARMGGSIVVLEPAAFAQWLNANRGPEDMATRGATLFRARGCSGCHGANATVHAPSLAGLFGRPVPLADGRTVIADERYLRDSMLLPSKEVAAGYPPIMPSFAGQLVEDEILDLVAYIKSLATTTAAAVERPQ